MYVCGAKSEIRVEIKFWLSLLLLFLHKPPLEKYEFILG